MLLEEDAPKIGMSPFFCGRRVRDQVDVSLVQQWLGICESQHGNSCGMVSGKFALCPKPPRDMEVIDMHNMCLVSAPEQCRYLALSYVWGKVEMLQTTTENLATLMHPGGLESRLHDLPLTVRDTFNLAKALGFEYVWVDTLCIVQDDMNSKHRQIAQMDKIYYFAMLTVVAFAGHDANRGLPGLSPSSRKKRQHVEEVQGLKLCVPLPNHLATGEENSARWSTRGWTYQERRLSRRILCFSETQVSFQCQYDFYCEDTHIEGAGRASQYYKPATNSPSSKTLAVRFGLAHNWNMYADTVLTYTQRNLSFEYDRLNAFLGIVGVFQRSFRCSLFNGLPMILIHFALLWQTLDPTSRRLTTFSPRSGSESFPRCLPSWSWVGWTGPVCIGPEPLYLVILPEIRIYTYDRRNAFRPIEDTYAIPNLESLWFGNRKILTSTGLPDESAHFPSPPDPVDMPAPTGTDSTEADTAVPLVTANHYFLYFRTTYSSNYFSIKGTMLTTSLPSHDTISVYTGRSFQTFWITDPAGNHAGTIRLTPKQASYYGTRENRTTETPPAEFIVLSRTNQEPYLNIGYHGARGRNLGQEWFQFDDRMWEWKDMCLLNVMLVKAVGDTGGTGDDDVEKNFLAVERIAVGVIHQDAWAAGGPRRRYIKLGWR
ncbi:hypothetical protein GJ744_003324 [Endocarpon pusillum]|uniref:Heterokaryon incompatibility domain-containing protein n=1 Tax=Endocarpon pusillum TaxID=364733 RepID=A0A8H7E265_9EURO|nr:hypothetical protein GJ744_003324 [Endocarpon pusillum]